MQPVSNQTVPNNVIEEVISAPPTENKVALDALVATHKSVPERLEKNRTYAKVQQESQIAKSFHIITGEIPAVLRVFVPYCGNYDRPIEGNEFTFNGRQVGMGLCQGRREKMEDECIATHQSFKIKDIEYPFDLFGVFDGHCGKEASIFVKEHMEEYLKNALEKHNQETLTEKGVFDALKAAFKKLHDDLNETRAGTTATISLILNDTIWVANAGDSRTILVKEGQIIQASEDAKPSMPRYQKTIEKLGGRVFCGRIEGSLGVARAIGDKSCKRTISGQCLVSPSPKITSYPLKDFQKGYLVLACDGLFDVATTHQVGLAVLEMAKSNESAGSMSKRLVYSAIRFGSEDNVTALVVKL